RPAAPSTGIARPATTASAPASAYAAICPASRASTASRSPGARPFWTAPNPIGELSPDVTFRILSASLLMASVALRLERADQLVHIRDRVLLEILADAGDDLGHRQRIGEIRRPHRDGARADDQEFERVLSGQDPAAANHRDLHRPAHSPD